MRFDILALRNASEEALEHDLFIHTDGIIIPGYTAWQI